MLARHKVVLLAVAISALAPAAVSAQSDQPPAVRVIGANLLTTSGEQLHRVGILCLVGGTNTSQSDESDCMSAKAKITVSNATKRKLKLRSTTLATGSASFTPGADGGWGLKLESSKATRKALKKVKKVDVTYSITFTKPVTETLTVKATMGINKVMGRLLLRSKDDTTAIAGGGRS